MPEFVECGMAGLAGFGLGVVFFGGLWWTIKWAMASNRPALWLFTSAILRISIVVGGLYLVGGGHWQRLLACLVGLMIGRVSILWLTRTTPAVEPHAT